jgi:hypothetical protein
MAIDSQPCPILKNKCDWLKCAFCRVAETWMYNESELARYNQRLELLAKINRLEA